MSKIIITESQYNKLINEVMAKGFSLKELDKIQDLMDKYAYCKKYLGDNFGQGNSRCVFEINEGRVLKLAYNPNSGALENQKEWINYEHYSKLGADKENDIDGMFKNMASLFPRCFAHAKDWTWIIVEEVLQIHKDDFMKVLGMPFEEEGKWYDSQYQPHFGGNVSSLGYKAWKYAEEKIDELKKKGKQFSREELSDYREMLEREYYARFDLHKEDEVSTDYSKYPNANNDSADWRLMKIFHPEYKEDENGLIDEFQPCLKGFMEWVRLVGKNREYELSEGICEYYRILSRKNQWFNALYLYLSHGEDDYCFNRDMFYDNFGLALRNGKPWIVLLDTGKDNNIFTPTELLRFS